MRRWLLGGLAALLLLAGGLAAEDACGNPFTVSVSPERIVLGSSDGAATVEIQRLTRAK